MKKQASILFASLVLGVGSLSSQQLTLPLKPDSVRFAVLGDTGTGGRAQYEIGARLSDIRARFRFEFVLMLGDNMYGSERPQDFVKKFEQPYDSLLKAGVKFYAALGNHDDPNQRFYEPFNMNGKRYYSFTKGDVAFFALDSTYVDRTQLDWIARELQSSGARWKVCFFHHPMYSSGARHGSELDLRALLEPLFVRHEVNVVFAGHEHFYERIKPQHGVAYFTAGGSAKLRAGNIRRSALTAAGFDRDNSFMLIEVAGDQLYFEAISRRGTRVDAGVIERTDATLTAKPAGGGSAANREPPVNAAPVGVLRWAS